jgi:hypothetical protein
MHEQQRDHLKDLTETRLSQAHGFFCMMGGLFFDASRSSPFLPHNRTRATLSLVGVRWVIGIAKKYNTPDLIPLITQSQIKDKGKTGAVQKTLAYIQCFWFGANCIARLSEGLPISLLELNTFAHVIVTFLTLYFWWNKPLDVNEPQAIQGEDAAMLGAYAFMASLISDNYSSQQYSEFQKLCNEDALGFPGIRPEKKNTDNITLRDQDSFAGFFIDKQSPCWSRTYALGTGGVHSLSGTHHVELARELTLTTVDQKKWKLARQAMNKFDLPKPTKDMGLIVAVTNLLSFPRDDKAEDDSEGEPPTYLALIGFALLTTIYGLLHALAWYLPSSDSGAEGAKDILLWRMSVCSITAFGWAAVLLAALLNTLKAGRAFWGCVLLPGIFLYVFPHLVLIVYVFVDVFYCPDLVYQLPQSWVTHFLHFGA